MHPAGVQVHDGGGVGPVGSQNDRLVAGVDHATDGQMQRLDPRGRDQDFTARIECYAMELRDLAAMACRRPGSPWFSV